MTTLTADDYHVGWICALSSELAASKAMLDEEHQMIHDKDPSDTNTYILGRIHCHNVVLACLPAGIDGTNAAAIVASNLLRTFKSLKFGLLVGIGGGIPNLDQQVDIRLGDVVVSQPSGRTGGVVQYDKGKAHEDGSFEIKGFLNCPPTLLLTALQVLQAEHEMQDSKIRAYLLEMSQKYPRMVRAGYCHSSTEDDILYCGHCNPTQSSCGKCKNGIISRSPRHQHDLEIHYGVIASGNRVVKSSHERDCIRSVTAAKCVEMEAAGLMNNFPCLVIRGICDYADGHKSDRWHKYAAATAAAYAKELLLHVSSQDTSREKSIQGIMGILQHNHQIAQENLKASKEHTEHLEQRSKIDDYRYNEREARDCHNAFKTSDYEEHKSFIPGHHPGTCQWVFQHDQYKEWLKCEHDTLLWISADPGCGKSVLAKTLVDTELLNSPTSSTCYFFFKDNQEQNQLCVALCAVLHQLFDHQPSLIKCALKTWRANSNRIANEIHSLWRILLAAAASPEAPDIILVFDALDECNEKDRHIFLSLLTTFYVSALCTSPSNQHSGRLKILVTSRPYEDIEYGFHDIPADSPSIRLKGEKKGDEIHQEIDTVIEAKVKVLGEDLRLGPLVVDNIKKQLQSMENRTYLWLHLAIQGVYETYRSALRLETEIVEALPSNVEHVYHQILSKVKPRDESTVKKIFTIIIGARRALTVREMAVALGIVTSSEFSSIETIPLDPSHLENRIKHWCGLFVSIHRSKIYLIHQTAKEFLLAASHGNESTFGWRHCLHPAPIEHQLAKLCVDYIYVYGLTRKHTIRMHHFDFSKNRILEFPDDDDNDTGSMDVNLSDDEGTTEMVFDTEPTPLTTAFFAAYAARYWLQHLQQALRFGPCSDVQIIDKVVSFHANRPIVHELWLWSLQKSSNNIGPSLSGPVAEGSTVIHTLALAGSSEVLAWFLEQPDHVDVNSTDEFGQTPLVLASACGHLDVVKLLLSHGANTAICGGPLHLQTPLYEACARGKYEVASLLLNYNADVNQRCSQSSWPLCAAVANAHTSMVELLLKFGADTEVGSGWESRVITRRGPLYIALSHKNDALVRLLIKHPNKANYLTPSPVKPAFDSIKLAIVCNCSRDILMMLYAYGAPLDNISGDSSMTALAWACDRGNMSGMRTLLDLGADINAFFDYKGMKHITVLYLAVYIRSWDQVEALLANGADINADCRNMDSPLRWMSWHAASSRTSSDDKMRVLRLLSQYTPGGDNSKTLG